MNRFTKSEKYLKKLFLNEQNLTDLASAYFPNECKIEGINVVNTINREFENNLIKEKLAKGKVDVVVVGWKAGKLKDYNYIENDGKYPNGYGNPISQKSLISYLEQVNNEHELQESFNTRIERFKSNHRQIDSHLDEYIDLFMEIYEKMLFFENNIKKKDRVKVVPDNFGSVYIINLIYFLSKGYFPIYDSFAHRALKGLMDDIHPYYCYVGGAPDKFEVKKVVDMYSEYIMLISKNIGMDIYGIGFENKENVDEFRKYDRALWVYGHADENFHGLNEIKRVKNTKY